MSHTRLVDYAAFGGSVSPAENVQRAARFQQRGRFRPLLSKKHTAQRGGLGDLSGLIRRASRFDAGRCDSLEHGRVAEQADALGLNPGAERREG